MALTDRGAKPPAWDQPAIQAEIHRRGSTIAKLSRDNGLARGTLQAVFYKRYPKGQAIVAKFIGRTRHELWPHWYGADDTPLPLGGRFHASSADAA